MKDYIYGNSKELDAKVDAAIEEYKKVLWVYHYCDACGKQSADVKYDSEACSSVCEDCLVKELRDDIYGLVSTGFLK